MAEPDHLFYERSARGSARYWAMLAVGLAFAWAGSSIDPLTNCSEDGECAPWLVPLAKWMGIVFAAAAAGHLWVNPRRGSAIDPESGDLLWWQNRLAGSPGDYGRIHPSRIGRIRILSDSDSDSIHLYDLDGARLPYFDTEVIPWPYDRWAARLAAQWPHIRVETV
ncbi:hypothetical protein [Sphingobium sp. CAP-1]|uniref:hypothetical protein n=1 Tax=Sphingobium sp. CAP-1 TaxID=2676077 RepID=UPI0012BB30D7|nr:hypothetical protein [Sphingobium sp. CAP-1]QGP80867.1 hypothetical protein GL174_17450 [Sphingobium sp. CAP-1]